MNERGGIGCRKVVGLGPIWVKRLQWRCGIKDMMLVKVLLLMVMVMMMVVVVVILRCITSITVTIITDDEMRWPINEEGRRYRQ